MNSNKDYKQIVEEFIYDFPICEFYFLTPDELIFSDKVRIICEQQCPITASHGHALRG